MLTSSIHTYATYQISNNPSGSTTALISSRLKEKPQRESRCNFWNWLWNKPNLMTHQEIHNLLGGFFYSTLFLSSLITDIVNGIYSCTDHDVPDCFQPIFLGASWLAMLLLTPISGYLAYLDANSHSLLSENQEHFRETNSSTVTNSIEEKLTTKGDANTSSNLDSTHVLTIPVTDEPKITIDLPVHPTLILDGKPANIDNKQFKMAKGHTVYDALEIAGGYLVLVKGLEQTFNLYTFTQSLLLINSIKLVYTVGLFGIGILGGGQAGRDTVTSAEAKNKRQFKETNNPPVSLTTRV